MATIDDFAKLEFKVGTVLEASDIEGSERLLKLKVDLGPIVIPSTNNTEESVDDKQSLRSGDLKQIAASPEESALLDDEQQDIRQILSGIKQWYKPEDLIGKQFVFIANLEPRMMMGLESQGMILAADGEKPVPLIPQEKVPNGAEIG